MTRDGRSHNVVEYIMDIQKKTSTAGMPWDESEHMAFLNGLQAFGKVRC